MKYLKVFFLTLALFFFLPLGFYSEELTVDQEQAMLEELEMIFEQSLNRIELIRSLIVNIERKQTEYQEKSTAILNNYDQRLTASEAVLQEALRSLENSEKEKTEAVINTILITVPATIVLSLIISRLIQ